MTGTTERFGRVSVFVDKERHGPLVFVSADSKGPRATFHSIPLSPKEARNLANWLNGAADDAERDETAACDSDEGFTAGQSPCSALSATKRQSDNTQTQTEAPR